MHCSVTRGHESVEGLFRKLKQLGFTTRKDIKELTDAQVVGLLRDALEYVLLRQTEGNRPLTVREAANRANVSVTSIRRLISSGQLPSHRRGPRGGSIRIWSDDIDNLNTQQESFSWDY